MHKAQASVSSCDSSLVLSILDEVLVLREVQSLLSGISCYNGVCFAFEAENKKKDTFTAKPFYSTSILKR